MLGAGEGARKRKGTPTRALEDQGLQLDVYAAYRQNPSQLMSISFTRPAGTALSCSSNLSSAASRRSSAKKRPPQTYKPDASNTQTSKPNFKPASSYRSSDYRDTQFAPSVLWKKGGLLDIAATEACYHDCTPQEITICSTLRILPEAYQDIKRIILSHTLTGPPFKVRSF